MPTKRSPNGKPPKPIRTLADLRPDPANANSGTQRGLRLLDDSLRDLGAGRSILADRNGVIIAGNKTVERAANIGLKKIRAVHTTGDELVVVIRDDLDLKRGKGGRGGGP